MLILSIIDEITKGYEGYPASALLLYGVAMVAALVVIGFIMSSRKWHDPTMVAYDGFEHDYYTLDEK